MNKHFSILFILLTLSTFAATSTWAQTLKTGAKGEQVRKWQHFLISRQFMEEPALGNYATRTVKATRDFQKKYGLPQNGALDAATLRKARALGFVPYAGPKNRVGKYFGQGLSIELKTGGVVIVQDKKYGQQRGTYRMQGDHVLFQFSQASPVMFYEQSVFQGEVLFSYLRVMGKDEDPGDWNPQFPDGYPYRKK